jgi:hypothetical protein
MNPPLLSIHSLSICRLGHLVPGPISWFRALCLLPLAIPGVRVVLSGFAWYGWLQWLASPFDWLAATAMILTFHVAIPILIAAGFYHVVRIIWPGETSRSIYRTFWFAASTVAILVLAFAGTVGVAALAEASICRVPQAAALVGGSCSNHFLGKDWEDIFSSMETYNFRYYNWLVWLAITAFLYRLETYVRERSLGKIKKSFQRYQDVPMEVAEAPELEIGSERLESPTSL